MTLPADSEALGLLEIEGLGRAARSHDAALKMAPVSVLACAPVSPGKVILILAGEVASVEEALAEADRVAGSRRIDRLMLPGVHPSVVEAVVGTRQARGREALGICETGTVAAAILGADIACKTAEITLGRLHLASGFGGRGFFSLWGLQCDVEAAVEAVAAHLEDRLLDAEVIAAPHDELDVAIFSRPWPLDPAD